MPNLSEELKELQYKPYPEIFAKFRELSARYGGLSMDGMISAFSRAAGFGTGRDLGESLHPKPPGEADFHASRQLHQGAGGRHGARSGRQRDAAPARWPTRWSGRRIPSTTCAASTRIFSRTEAIFPRRSWRRRMRKKRNSGGNGGFSKSWKKAFRLPEAAHEIVGQALVEGKVFYHPRFPSTSRGTG